MSNPNPDIIIVYPSRCKTCIEAGVPAEQRAVVIIDNEERCGACGNPLGSTYSLTSTEHQIHSPAVRSLIRSFLEHGLFAVDCSFGSFNPVRLLREDPQTKSGISCRISYSTVCSEIPPERYQAYDRSKIACPLPSGVRAACEQLSQIKLGNRRPTFVQADVKRERKMLRFSWLVPLTELVQQNKAHESLSIEISWTAKLDGECLLPTPDQTRFDDAQAEELRIAADVAALRLACVQGFATGRGQVAITLMGRYCSTAVEQVSAELEGRGWKVQVVDATSAISYLSIERKPVA